MRISHRVLLMNELEACGFFDQAKAKLSTGWGHSGRETYPAA
ncbi:MAG: hypothetical protein H6Q00_418 [Holophagaceae bacterium]|nr:hypothetical protein [Holophagaceae bacterium]